MAASSCDHVILPVHSLYFCRTPSTESVCSPAAKGSKGQVTYRLTTHPLRLTDSLQEPHPLRLTDSLQEPHPLRLTDSLQEPNPLRLTDSPTNSTTQAKSGIITGSLKINVAGLQSDKDGKITGQVKTTEARWQGQPRPLDGGYSHVRFMAGTATSA